MFLFSRRRLPFVNFLQSLLMLHCPLLISAQCKIDYQLPMLGSNTNHLQMFEWNPPWDPIFPSQRQLGNVSLDACESFDWNIHYQSPDYSIVSSIERGNGENEDWVICLARDSVTSSILISSGLSVYPSYTAATTPFTTSDCSSFISSVAESNTDIFHWPPPTPPAAPTSAASTGVPIIPTSAAPSSTSSAILGSILSSILESAVSSDVESVLATDIFTRSPPTFTESFTTTSSSAHSETWVGVLYSILPSEFLCLHRRGALCIRSVC